MVAARGVEGLRSRGGPAKPPTRHHLDPPAPSRPPPAAVAPASLTALAAQPMLRTHRTPQEARMEQWQKLQPMMADSRPAWPPGPDFRSPGGRCQSRWPPPRTEAGAGQERPRPRQEGPRDAAPPPSPRSTCPRRIGPTREGPPAQAEVAVQPRLSGAAAPSRALAPRAGVGPAERPAPEAQPPVHRRTTCQPAQPPLSPPDLRWLRQLRAAGAPRRRSRSRPLPWNPGEPLQPALHATWAPAPQPRSRARSARRPVAPQARQPPAQGPSTGGLLAREPRAGPPLPARPAPARQRVRSRPPGRRPRSIFRPNLRSKPRPSHPSLSFQLPQR